MRKFIFYLTILLFISCNNKKVNIIQTESMNNSIEIVNDSNAIALTSLTFYNWYLDCLKADSTYNIVQPIYHWINKIPILDISEYLKRLKNLGVVSDDFIKTETARFKICQDSLNTINFEEVDSCGCSVGEFFQVCDFVDYFYWINTQEKYDGCEIQEIKINNLKATCKLLFFYNSNNSKGKQYDRNFICILNLKKNNNKWLIDTIDKNQK
jgi:hypothetical protein